MTSTDQPATPTSHPLAPDEASEVAGAAAELEALADAYDECSRSLEALEAAIDTLLDDASTSALVLDEKLRVLGVSRGMASVLGLERLVLGSGVAGLVPPDWPDLPTLLGSLGRAEGWRSVALGDDGATLQVRRATDDDRSAVYVVRYLPGMA
jgi:hypothetical protein